MIKFKVVDTDTGKFPKYKDIKDEIWYKESDLTGEIESFALHEDGYLIAFDSYGHLSLVPEERFDIVINV